jgi:hypothetical protein
VTSAGAEVIVVQARHVIAGRAADMICTKTSNATAVKTADATSTEATHLTSAKTTHVAPAEATHAPTMSSTPSAAAGLCTCGKKAAGKRRACQNHHYSCSHDILHLRWADVLPGHCPTLARPSEVDANVAMHWRWECPAVVSTKFAFIRIEYGSVGRERPSCETQPVPSRLIATEDARLAQGGLGIARDHAPVFVLIGRVN